MDIPYLLIPLQGVLYLNYNNNKMSFVFRILPSDNKTRNTLRLQTHGKKNENEKKEKKKKKKKKKKEMHSLSLRSYYGAVNTTAKGFEVTRTN